MKLRSRLFTFAAGTVAAVLSLGGLTACGGGDDDYCDAVKAAVANDDDMSQEDALAVFEDLAEIAPDEIKDDFDQITSLSDTAESLSPDDMETMSPEELEDAMADLEESTGDLDDMSGALENIATYTSEECGVDL